MVQRITLAPQGPEFSRFVMGYWRLMEWNMTPRQLVSFIEEHLDLGVTTVDHADIYGGYACEAAFGEALKLAPHLRERMEIVTKCGIATTAKPEHALGHYITDRNHIIHSAEQSLRNLATDVLDLLLIHRPDPLMDADEVADAFTSLKQAGKIKHAGVSNFTARQFDAAEAQAMGLVNRTFADAGALREGVTAIAAAIAAKSPLTVRGVKQVLNYSRDHSVADGLDYVATWNAALLLSDDTREAIMATMQKRQPRFKD